MAFENMNFLLIFGLSKILNQLFLTFNNLLLYFDLFFHFFLCLNCAISFFNFGLLFFLKSFIRCFWPTKMHFIDHIIIFPLKFVIFKILFLYFTFQFIYFFKQCYIITLAIKIFYFCLGFIKLLFD